MKKTIVLLLIILILFSSFSIAAQAGIKIWPGKVRVEITDSPGRPGEELFHNYMPQKDYKESYMVIECGIGSGSVFTLGKNIFSTKSECDVAINKYLKEQADNQQKGGE